MLCVGSTGPCTTHTVVTDGPIFGGSISTTSKVPGGSDTALGSTCATCIGTGAYVFKATSSNAHCTVSPASVTVTATNALCTAKTTSSPSLFTFHYDYWDSPNTLGTLVGNSLGAICGCISVACDPFPDTVNIAPTNTTGNDAVYLKKTGGDCNHSPSTAVFTSTGYSTDVYQSQALTFQALPAGLAAAGPIFAFSLGGTVNLPSYGYFSSSFTTTHIPDQGCGFLCVVSERNPDAACNAFPPTVYTSWYLMTCSGVPGSGGTGGLDLYLIERADGFRYDCNFTGPCFVTFTATVSWNVTKVWSWRDSSATCSPLFVQDGFVTSGTTPTFKMTMTS